jgi:hypothetical protein
VLPGVIPTASVLILPTVYGHLKRMKKYIYAIAILFSLNSFADDCKVEVILAENTKLNSAPTYKKVKEAIEADPHLKNNPMFAEMTEPRDDISLMYIADINNDGNPEYIFTSPGSGSGGFIHIFVFQKAGDKFVHLEGPPTPKGSGDGPWYFQWHRDPKTKQIKFLVKSCGLTYMQFDLGPEKKLERYLWKNGMTERVSVK